MKLKFNELFEINNGIINPKVEISVEGDILTANFGFRSGNLIKGINLSEHTESFFEVDIINEIYIIKEIYK